MTDQEQQIALCEWMGWRRSTYAKENCLPLSEHPLWVSPEGNRFDDFGDGSALPNTSSLDVLSDMEKKLNENQRICYIQQLVAIANTLKPPFFHAVIAPPNIRREALLRTLGLWRD